MEFIIADIFFTLIGWFYMLIRFLNRKKREKILKNKFADSYQMAGTEKVLKSIAILFMLFLAICGLALLISTLYKQFV